MMKILVAEDDATSRVMLRGLLLKWDFEVVMANNGEEAWARLLCPDAPRLVILDWVMPGLSGVELCRLIRQGPHGDSTYVMLLTSRDSKEDIVQGLDAGANDYIGKPFHNEELRARLSVGRRMVELRTALAERIQALEEAVSHIKRLQGIFPICMHCHKIRTDQESWTRIEEYISEHSDAQFSHSLCPECCAKYYPETE